MFKLMQGDCLELMKDISDNSVDSIITDPPYELGFMGKKWDSTGIAYNVDVWKECLRVLKPGGHLLAFGGTRTYHRMTCAIEDAGFEIRDCIQWLYGTGFPKSHDISKAIDKKLGAEREKLGIAPTTRAKTDVDNQILNWGGHGKGKIHYVTKPATKQAEQWDGWGTALKPANEPIVLARKPISEKTVAENVLKWGTGGLNIDGCRVGWKDERDRKKGWRASPSNDDENEYSSFKSGSFGKQNEQGRFPANVILDEEAGRMLDEQTGTLKSGFMKAGHPYGQGDGQNVYGKLTGKTKSDTYGDSGGASRFFYVAKASKKERTHNGKVENKHPTVKPLKLMRFLCRLITPPGGKVLDPFAGSGTTILAAIQEGFSVIGIEREPEYCEIIRKRMAELQPALPLVR